MYTYIRLHVNTQKEREREKGLPSPLSMDRDWILVCERCAPALPFPRHSRLCNSSSENNNSAHHHRGRISWLCNSCDILGSDCRKKKKGGVTEKKRDGLNPKKGRQSNLTGIGKILFDFDVWCDGGDMVEYASGEAAIASKEKEESSFVSHYHMNPDPYGKIDRGGKKGAVRKKKEKSMSNNMMQFHLCFFFRSCHVFTFPSLSTSISK